MVRLKVLPIIAPLYSFACFNSTMVRLKVHRETLRPFTHLSFNSTMVRLKECRTVRDLPPAPGFNSTMVRLKVTRAEDNLTIIGRRFNSTMVRLKGMVVGMVHGRLIVFQFHNGSIKRMSNLGYRLSIYEFQFHNGSIKRMLMSSNLRKSTFVSIPQWFD